MCKRQYLEKNEQIYLVRDAHLIIDLTWDVQLVLDTEYHFYIYKGLLLFHCGTVSSLLIRVLLGKQSV